MPENEGQQSPRNAQKFGPNTMHSLAELLRKQDKTEVANQLESPGLTQSEIQERQHKDHEGWMREMEAKTDVETPIVSPIASGPNPQRGGPEMDAMVSAIEQAKRLPVPSGEEAWKFYHRKALEILESNKQQNK